MLLLSRSIKRNVLTTAILNSFPSPVPSIDDHVRFEQCSPGEEANPDDVDTSISVLSGSVRSKQRRLIIRLFTNRSKLTSTVSLGPMFTIMVMLGQICLERASTSGVSYSGRGGKALSTLSTQMVAIWTLGTLESASTS